jgi:hypothetical protein
MLDILDREIHIGNLLITHRKISNSCVLEKSAFAIAISDTKAYNGKSFQYEKAYLIENPSERELEIQIELQNSYVKSMEKKVSAEKKKNKPAKSQSELKSLIKIGDIFELYNYKYVYLGICEVTYSNCTYKQTGYTYIAIPGFPTNGLAHQSQLEEWNNYVNEHKDILFNDLLNRWIQPNVSKLLLDTKSDFYESVYSPRYITKKLSTRFIAPIYHIEISDWKVNTSKTYAVDALTTGKIVRLE